MAPAAAQAYQPPGFSLSSSGAAHWISLHQHGTSKAHHLPAQELGEVSEPANTQELLSYI